MRQRFAQARAPLRRARGTRGVSSPARRTPRRPCLRGRRPGRARSPVGPGASPPSRPSNAALPRIIASNALTLRRVRVSSMRLRISAWSIVVPLSHSRTSAGGAGAAVAGSPAAACRLDLGVSPPPVARSPGQSFPPDALPLARPERRSCSSSGGPVAGSLPGRQEVGIGDGGQPTRVGRVLGVGGDAEADADRDLFAARRHVGRLRERRAQLLGEQARLSGRGRRPGSAGTCRPPSGRRRRRLPCAPTASRRPAAALRRRRGGRTRR